MIHYSNGKLRSKALAVNPTAPGFRYGTGFFETIYYNGNNLCHLDLHLDRLFHSLRAHDIAYDTIDFERVVNILLDRNELSGSTARVNIVYSAGTSRSHPVVLVAPFEPRPYKAYRLCLCEERHVSHLNAHKTNSYMFFHLAHKQANAAGFDDSALFDFDNNLLEATTGAILFKKNGSLYEPQSDFKLPSTTLAQAKTIHDITTRPINRDELGEFRHAYLLNSLIGMRPIVGIGEYAFAPDEGPCEPVTSLVLGC